VTGMWLLTFGGYGADREVDTPIHRPSVGAGKNRPAEVGAKANIQHTPSDAKRPSAASGRKPQIAGIEHLRVLQGSDEQHRLRVQVGLLLSMVAVA
jgi:hypothetical protein